MREREWSEFWWTNITGSNYVVSQVVQTLLDNSTVIIEVPSDLPWRREMRSAIETSFRGQSASSDTIIEVIDAVDDCTSGRAPGKYLLEQYGQSREVRNGYRERSGKSIQEYLKEKAVLKNRIIWVKGLTGKQAEAWVKFCKEFGPESPEKGLFVLEIHGAYSKAENRTIRTIRFLNFVTSYDVQLFNSFILDGKKGLSAEWKKYISTAAASLCDTDAEISEMLLQVDNLKSASLLDEIDRIAAYPHNSARGGDSDSTHVLAYSRNGNRSELEHRLWKAQIQALFPIIELERISLIENYRESLKEALSSHYVEQYKAQVVDPTDVELGTFCYLLTVGYIDIYDSSIRDRIFFLHECRNLLAHAHCCRGEQVIQLLDKGPLDNKSVGFFAGILEQ